MVLKSCVMSSKCHESKSQITLSNPPKSPVAGAQEKIASLRYRHEMISESIAHLEDRVATNTAELDEMRHSYGDDEENFQPAPVAQPDVPEVTDEDIERELAEIRDLELRKRSLQERVTGMERDLGGLIG